MGTIYRVGLLLLGACLLIAIGLIGACGDDETEEPTETQVEEVKITVGNLSDLTGPASHALSIVNTALEDLVNYFNDQDLIPGVRMEVITYDGQYDPSRDIPGYEWLMDRGADVIFTGVPHTAATLKPRLDKDEVVLFSLPVTEVPEDPGWVFYTSSPPASDSMTLLKWIADKEWDYETKGAAKVGAAGWVGPYEEALHEGLRDYCNAHPDQFTWEGSYLTAYSMTWGPEVDELIDCDYVMAPATGGGLTAFMTEFRQAGGEGTFLGNGSHPAYLGLTLDAVGWDGLDGFLYILQNGYWGDDLEIPQLSDVLLSEYHSASEAEDIKRSGISYLGSVGQMYGPLLALKAAVEEVGPTEFDSKVLYDTCTSFSMAFSGCKQWDWTETKRTCWNYLGVWEASAADEDLVRKDPEWQRIVYTP